MMIYIGFRAVMVPMHIGLIDGPLGHRKEPKYTFLFSQKSHQVNPLRVPQWGLYERYPFTGHFYLSLDIYFYLKGSDKRVSLHIPSKQGLWKQTPIPEP
jgi:hypothetical protein